MRECTAEQNGEKTLWHQAADAIEELQAQLMFSNDAAKTIAEKVPKWIPVTERLPEDGAEVLAFNKTGFAYVDCWADGKWKINSMVDEEHEIVTHWMPLPEPPDQTFGNNPDNCQKSKEGES